MRIKFVSLICCIVVFDFVRGNCQTTNSSLNRIEHLRKAFICEQVCLRPEQEDGFWAIYRVYSNQLNQLKSEMSEKMGALDVCERRAFDKKILGLELRYMDEFETVLDERQMQKMFRNLRLN